MSSRYTILTSLQGSLYAEGAPVIISAGNLLKDDSTGNVLAQLKIKNTTSKTIRAAAVLIRGWDTFRETVDDVLRYDYIDLSVKPGGEFGQKTSIELPSKLTRNFTAEVEKVLFSDGSIWESRGVAWEPLPEPVSLSDYLGDRELLKQYGLRVGSGCKFRPQEHKDLWLCSCGAWNKEQPCYVCGKDKAVQFALSIDELKAEKDARLQREKEEREKKEEKEKAEREKRKAEAAAEKRRKQKIGKRIAIMAGIAAVCTALVFLLITVVIPQVKNVIIPDARYNKALSIMDSGDYETAVAAFEALDGYKDSDAKIEECKTAIKDTAYGKALELKNAGDFEVAIIAFEALDGYRDSEEQIREIKSMYQKEQLPDSELSEAEVADADLPDTEMFNLELLNADIGEYVVFGSYEQDNITENGKEPIEWLVLDKQEGRVLVISRYALDCQQYNTSIPNAKWETSSLRTWLNQTFINVAFSEEEKSRIPSMTVRTDDNPINGTGSGNSTTDQLFLLSRTEAKEYFSADSARQCQGTAYCYAQGAARERDGNCWWWLRSPGDYSFLASTVTHFGAVGSNGYDVGTGNGAVRPAMWIDAGSIGTSSAEGTITEINSDGTDIKTLLTKAEVGDAVLFGSYEQDNDTSNGKEKIEWLVLDKQDGKLLVISRYALDCQPYNAAKTSVTWETCSLREWLNGSFLNAAFSEEERAMIPSVTVSAEKNPNYSTDPGNSTTDRVFLLSIPEANMYFRSESSRRCQGSEYCYAQGASNNGNVWWWLRSPGWRSNATAYVNTGGYIYDIGYLVNYDCYAVRPALWIDLGS